MKIQSGSLWWLMHHELRLYFRSAKVKATHLISIIIALVLLHVVAVPIAYLFKKMPVITPTSLLVILTVALAALLFLMISRGLVTVVDAVYTRGDMDLLLSSPLAPRSIIGVRAAAIAITLCFEAAFLIWPFANVFVLFGFFGWLKAYFVVPAMSMLACTISMVIGLGLFRILGARRTRVVAQILAAIIGMCFMLLGQLPNLLNSGANKSKLLSPISSWSTESVLFMPAHWVNAGLLSTLLLTLTCVAFFSLMIYLLGERFIQASSESASLGVAKPTHKSTKTFHFNTELNHILIKKELRLIGRDPALLTQLLMQSVYMLPMLFIVWQQHGDGLPWHWLLIIFMLGQTASALAWITVAAEDSPDLLMTAPVSKAILVRAKTAAALLPLAPFVILPCLSLCRSYPLFGLLITLCASGCCIHLALRHTHNPIAGKRGDFKTRYKNNVGQSLIELAIIIFWASVCALLTWLSTKY